MNDPAKYRVLAFDVFGTVVDWRGSIAREVDAMNLGVDGAEFADRWRAGYAPAMDKVRSGALPWTRIDDLHRMILDEVLTGYGIALPEATRREMNLVWHRLDPWPDAVAGLTRLKRRYTITTLSNGNIGLLTDMAKRAGLPWDCVLSAEVFRHYKPDPQTYLGVCDVFAIEPSQMLMCAAHPSDLRAARDAGCATAYVHRPLEYGVHKAAPMSRGDGFDVYADDFEDLATRLGC